MYMVAILDMRKKSSSYIEMIKKGKKVKRDEKILDDAAADDLVKIEFEDNKFTICTDGKFLGDDKLSEYLHLGVNLVKILVPLILLVLGSLDFAKAIFAQDDAAMNKAQKTFIKRLIIAVVIFVIPGLLKVILNIAHGIWPIVDNSLCGII